MKLDEAIKHLEELIGNDIFGCDDCRKEHIQLLKWLKELRELRNEMKLGKFLIKHLFQTTVRIYDTDGETELYKGKAEDTPLSLSQRKISFVCPRYDEKLGVVLDIVLAESDDNR